MENWIYKNEIFTSENIGDYYGFVYNIFNKSKGKYYIGQKSFWKKIKRPPLKGKTRKRNDIVESDWKKYQSSCKKLQEDIENGDMIEKEILKLCTSKSSLNYYELKYQMEHDALFKEEYYNGIINVRISSVCNKNILKDVVPI